MRNVMILAAVAGAASVAAAQSTVYFSDFEADGGGWTPSGVNGDWERGMGTGFVGGSSSTEPLGGFSGDWVWGTVIGGDHGVGSDEQLSQNFDFTGLSAYDGLGSVDIVFNFTSTTVVERTGWYIDDVSIRAIPAPGAMALLGLGGLVAVRRRR